MAPPGILSLEEHLDNMHMSFRNIVNSLAPNDHSYPSLIMNSSSSSLSSSTLTKKFDDKKSLSSEKLTTMTPPLSPSSTTSTEKDIIYSQMSPLTDVNNSKDLQIDAHSQSTGTSATYHHDHAYTATSSRRHLWGLKSSSTSADDDIWRGLGLVGDDDDDDDDDNELCDNVIKSIDFNDCLEQQQPETSDFNSPPTPVSLCNCANDSGDEDNNINDNILILSDSDADHNDELLLHMDSDNYYINDLNIDECINEEDDKKTSHCEFFSGLDDLDLDEFDPCSDIAKDDTLSDVINESFCDTLFIGSNSTTNVQQLGATEIDEDEESGIPRTESGEDLYKKEFFFKMLGLEPASASIHRTPAKCHPNIVADQSESETNNSTSAAFSSKQETISIVVCDPIISVDSSAQSCDGSSNDSFSLSQTLSLQTNYGPTNTLSVSSVPVKSYSCACASSLLYATSPGYDENGRCQTKLSTTISTSPRLHSNTDSYFSNKLLDSSDLTEWYKEDYGDMVSDELLQIFEEKADEEENFNNIAVPSRKRKMSIGNTSYNYNSDSSQSKNKSPKFDHSESSHPNSPSVIQSNSDLDSFIDLEEFASKCASDEDSSFNRYQNYYSNTNTNNNNNQTKPQQSNLNLNDKIMNSFDNSNSNDNSRNSELHFRLSLLDDQYCVDHHLNEKKNSSSFKKLNESSLVYNNTHQFELDLQDDSVFGYDNTDNNNNNNHSLYAQTYTSHSSSSSPVSSQFNSSSSPLSSSRYENDKNSLDLLGLFSEENSSMLMERSGTAVSTVAQLAGHFVFSVRD